MLTRTAAQIRIGILGLGVIGNRIERFLRTGKVKIRFIERLAPFGALCKALVMIPVAVPIIGTAIAILPFRLLFGRRSRFVPTRAPETLPPEQTGVPTGYWYALLPDLADQQEEVESQVRKERESRTEDGMKVYLKDIVQWGGYRLKEVRRQLVLEFHRAKVYLGVYRYGRDLYVRWDSHINRHTWFLRKFPHHVGVGYRFDKSFLSWAVPLLLAGPGVPADSASRNGCGFRR